MRKRLCTLLLAVLVLLTALPWAAADDSTPPSWITNGTSADDVAQDRDDGEEDEEAEAEDSGSQSIPAENPSGSALITDSHVAYLTGSGGLFRPQDNLTRAEAAQIFLRLLKQTVPVTIHYTDVPAGDMGVGGREIGYLFGQYRRLKGVWENGVLTGKGFSYGGSLTRPEATGYGAMYYLQEVLKHEGEDIKGKTIACAGFGNVTWGICKKALHLGAKVVTLSGPDGYIYDEEGVSSSQEKVDYLLEMRNSGRNRVQDYADKFGVPFYPGEKPWGVKVDVVMPSAMQNDVHMEHAKQIVANGVKYYIEVANMPTTNDALFYLMEQPGVIVAPSKAVNAGGVGVSALEMSQNSERLVWTAEEVDAQLHKMMENIHRVSMEAAEEYGLGYNLVAGANLAGFKKVAEAMMEQGVF